MKLMALFGIRSELDPPSFRIAFRGVSNWHCNVSNPAAVLTSSPQHSSPLIRSNFRCGMAGERQIASDPGLVALSANPGKLPELAPLCYFFAHAEHRLANPLKVPSAA